MDTKVLEKIGLTGSEVSVYLKLLETGPTKTGYLTSKANVSRSKIYEVLDKLIAKGLVSYVIRENIKYFEASDPRNLKELIERRKQELKDDEKELNALIPGLISISDLSKEKIITSVFEGYEGMKTVFNDILNTMKRGEEYYGYAVEMERYSKDFSLFVMNYHKKREERGIKVKLLSTSNIKERVLEELGGYKGMEFRFTQENIPSATIIYKDKVFQFIWKKEPVAIMIKSKDIYERHRKNFIDAWKRAE